MKILLLIFGFTLFSCSWTTKTEKKSIIPNLNIEQKKAEKISHKTNSTFGFNQLEVGRKVLYTGQRKIENGKTKTNGIYIKKITETKIEYNYTQLINWKKEFDKIGVANLTSISDSITTRNELKEESYKFVDSENDIVIYVTKNERVNSTRAKVFNKSNIQISELMYNK